MTCPCEKPDLTQLLQLIQNRYIIRVSINDNLERIIESNAQRTPTAKYGEIKMKGFAILPALMFLCLTCNVFAADNEVETQSAIQLKEKGFKACAHAVDDIAHFVFQSDFAYFNLWNQTNVEKHSVLVTGAKTYTVGKSILTITATESQVRTCDASFTLVMPFPEDCTQLRQTTFKEWKFYSDKLDGISVYEDPSTPTVNLALEPFQGGCLAVKTGLFFLSREK